MPPLWYTIHNIHFPAIFIKTITLAQTGNWHDKYNGILLAFAISLCIIFTSEITAVNVPRWGLRGLQLEQVIFDKTWGNKFNCLLWMYCSYILYRAWPTIFWRICGGWGMLRINVEKIVKYVEEEYVGDCEVHAYCGWICNRWLSVLRNNMQEVVKYVVEEYLENNEVWWGTIYGRWWSMLMYLPLYELCNAETYGAV